MITCKAVLIRASTCAISAAVCLVLIAAGCTRHEAVANAQGPKPAPSNQAASQQPASAAGYNANGSDPGRRASRPQPAHVAPYERTDLHAKVAGYLESFGQLKLDDGQMRPVDIGDLVAKGQVLAVIAIPEMDQERLQKEALVEQAQAEVGQADAAIQSAEAMIDAALARVEATRSQLARFEAEVAFRKSEHNRITALVKERAVQQALEDEKLNQLRAAEAAKRGAEATLTTSEAELRVERAALLKAKADRVSAEARLKVATANHRHSVILLEYTHIKAPYDGIIVRRMGDTGTFVQSAASGNPEPLFTIARVDRLRIVSDLPESDAELVTVGQPTLFTVGGARAQPLPGKVARLAGALDSATRTMRIEVELDKPSLGLRPGMFGSLLILKNDSVER